MRPARDVRVDQQVWVLAGAIEISLGDHKFFLKEGDCLTMQLNRRTPFSNPHRQSARYIVAITANAFAKN